MDWLIFSALIVGAVVTLVALVLAVFVGRQGWREGGRVEMPGGETIFGPTHEPEPQRRPRDAAP